MRRRNHRRKNKNKGNPHFENKEEKEEKEEEKKEEKKEGKKEEKKEEKKKEKKEEKDNKNEEEKEEDNEEEEDELVCLEELHKIISTNKLMNNKELENINLYNLRYFSNQNQKQQIEKNNIEAKIKFNEILEVEYDKIPYQLFIYLKEDNNNLAIDLIPKEGHLPYSYCNNFDTQTFYEISSIFMELKTIEKIGKKIINLFNKKRVSIAKDKNEDKFYLILKITIIDEDKEILLPLNKNENIQVCTINYLLREAKEMKNEFSALKKEEKKEKELEDFRKTNKFYIDLINKIKKENREEEISDDDEIINDDDDYNIDNSCLKKISKLIIDQNEEYIKLKNKINKMENDFNALLNNFKCDVGPKNVILNLDINHIKPYVLIHFEIENTGNYALNTKYDDMFCSIEGISSETIRFYNTSEKYIYLNQSFMPKQKINICKKIIINNPISDKKYEFNINIYTLSHGKISENSTKVIIYIRNNDEEEEDENFISFLSNEKLDYDIKNKKIIFEYFEEVAKCNENQKNMVDIGVGVKKKKIKIYKYLYNTKSGMAENNDEDKDKIDAFVVINMNDINKLINKIYDKYKESKKIEKYRIKDVICTCAGDFQKICDLIENMIG